MAAVRAWGLRYSYGKIELDYRVHDAQAAGPKPTTQQDWWSLSQRALWAVPGGYPSGNVRLLTLWPGDTPWPYNAYSYSRFILLRQWHDRPQIFAHEILHTLGLLHAMVGGVEYGSKVDVMGDVFAGDLSTLGLSALHRHVLGVLSPQTPALPFRRALSDIDREPDAIRIGDIYIERRGDLVYVHGRGSFLGGGADQDQLAVLSAGQTAVINSLRVAHEGGGVVVVQ